MSPKRSLLRSLVLSCLVALPIEATAQTAPPLLPLERQIRNGAPVLQRVAVVIGNGGYLHADTLRNPVNDARAVAGVLRENGFRVLDGYDLDKAAIERLLRDAVMAGGTRSEMVVFFAGHGIQIAEQSYLLPIDALLTDPNDVPFQTVSLDRLLETLRGQSGSQIAVFDACRNNPFEGKTAGIGLRGRGATIERGFTQPAPPPDTLLAFSTAPGTLALDGGGENSPYTSALIGAARISPESSIEAVLTAVERIVEQSTGGNQKPVYSSALTQAFALRPPPLAPLSVAQTLVPPMPVDAVSAPGDIIVPRERIIAVGSRMLDRLSLDGAQIVFDAPPPGTSYGMATATGGIVDLPAAPVPASALNAVVLRLDAVATKDVSPVTGIVTHPLNFERLDPGGYRTPRGLSISIVPDACDIEAGDWFDPQGVGVHRLDKVVRPERAIAACSIALAASPDSARLRYQLGRAMDAADRDGEAERLYREAAEAGHVRAWLGLGKRLKASGDLAGAAAAFERGRAGGDPQATAALGSLMLDAARSEEEEQDAYALLSEGVDLGLWSSMETLSAFYERAGTDQSRAERFRQEAQRRRDDVDKASVPDAR